MAILPARDVKPRNIVYTSHETEVQIKDNRLCDHLAIIHDSQESDSPEADGGFDWIVTGTRQGLLAAFEAAEAVPYEPGSSEAFYMVDMKRARDEGAVVWHGDDDDRNPDDNFKPGSNSFVSLEGAARDAILQYLRRKPPAVAHPHSP
jgi:hypothetical protein